MDYIDLTRVRFKWQAVVNTVIIRWVKHNSENFLISWGTCCMKLLSCLSDKSRNRILNQLSTSPVKSEVTCLGNSAATNLWQTAASRCKNVPTFQGLTVSPSQS